MDSREYGNSGLAINKMLSPKQISTNPLSSGFKAFVPWPFIYASKCGIKG